MTRKQFISYVEDFRETLRRFLVALCCGDTFLADEIAQETFVKAYLSLETFKDSSKFKAWIYRIAYNTFLNHKRNQRFPLSSDDIKELPANDTSADPFKYEELYMALNQLSSKERISILLYYMQGYSVKEIGRITGESDENIRQHLSRGRKRLHDLIKS